MSSKTLNVDTLNLNTLLESSVSRPDAGLRLLNRHEDATWASWGSIYRAARGVGARLVALGLEPGERVALVYPTGLDFFHSLFGVLAAGGVPVPLYPPVRLGRLDEYHRRTAAMLRAASARLVMTEGRIKRLLGPTIASARPCFGCRTLDDLPKVPEGAAADVEVGPDDLALVQFSSGTTVDPKPVALSHRAILAQARILNSFWPESSEIELEGLRHSGVSWLPLYHDMGLIGCIFPAIELRTALTLIGPEVFVSRPAVWLRTLSRYRATVSPAPNFAYGLCVEKVRDEELEGVDLSNWRVALNGAEPVAPAVLRRFQERFAPWGFRPEALTPVYGLSEASLAVTFSAIHAPFSTARFDRCALAEDRVSPIEGESTAASERGQELPSLGPPLPEFELRIGDEVGKEAPPDRVGRVLVKGPSLMEGYLDQPEATVRAFVDGWLDTGDLGFLHEGELYLTGRAKDVVILRGRNHPPHDIEQAVGDVAGMRKGCAVAASHLEEGADTESLFLFVEKAREARVDEIASLPKACREAVLKATGLRVDQVIVLEPGTLPRTSSGKLRRGETLKLHLRGALRPPKKVTALTIGGALAKSALAYAGMRRKQQGSSL